MQDERIITEMHKIGEQFPERIASGHYQRNGRPECIVGQLCQMLGKFVPMDNSLLAGPLFAEYGASKRMQAALFAAQAINDQRMPWKWAVRAFDLATQQYTGQEVNTTSCPCGCASNSSMLIKNVIDQVMIEAGGGVMEKFKSEADALTEKIKAFAESLEMTTNTFAQGGIISTTSATGQKITINYPTISAPSYHQSVSGNLGLAWGAKKDHALVA